MSEQLTIFEPALREKHQPKIVNIASVPKRSPFRYPGGKTWLVPTIRKWLKQEKSVIELIKPFAGGGIVSLTATFENLSQQIKKYCFKAKLPQEFEIINIADLCTKAGKRLSYLIVIIFIMLFGFKTLMYNIL